MTTIHYLNVLNDPDENQIIKKLPTNIVARWSRVVDEWIAEVEPEEEYSTPQLVKKQLKAEYPPSQNSARLCVRKRELRVIL